MRRSAKKHIRANRLFPPLHIIIRLFVESFWIDTLCRQFFHSGVGKLTEVIHLRIIINQCKFHLLLVAAVWGVCQTLQHIIYNGGIDIFIFISATGMSVGNQGTHCHRCDFTINNRQAIVRFMSENGNGTRWTDSKTMLAFPTTVPPKFLEICNLSLFCLIQRKNLEKCPY